VAQRNGRNDPCVSANDEQIHTIERATSRQPIHPMIVEATVYRAEQHDVYRAVVEAATRSSRSPLPQLSDS
jgi:hypothetical protein